MLKIQKNRIYLVNEIDDNYYFWHGTSMTDAGLTDVIPDRPFFIASPEAAGRCRKTFILDPFCSRRVLDYGTQEFYTPRLELL